MRTLLIEHAARFNPTGKARVEAGFAEDALDLRLSAPNEVVTLFA